ncbi:glycosyltransferase [Ornithinibacillus halophilus]|uniref:Glycosyltransferase involved in cell wall bisynthesis n=1 Tax=Ornithinibacillus halophilus TaxID=930117 RepID=A0A1M5EAC9_9BACI|nr:glycosyltransferase [Ornithinibacillus halophilus]SHF76094.1 Glycosyltransferase involved in cell wall bisynthesis [Ornithinibacillus halophilus]
MDAAKRVVHLTTVHHPYDPRIYHKECKSLQAAGFDVTLVAKEDPTDSRKNETIKHVKLKSYSNRLKRMIFGTVDAYKKAKQLNADVYHFHDPELLPIGWLLKKKNNVVIYDIHEDYVTSIMQKEYMNKPLKKVISTLYKWMEKLFAKKMELCLAEKYYKDIYPNGKCILNYPTINENILRHQRDIAKVDDSVLYTGNVTHVRGALIHAKIPAIHPSVSVHYVGLCKKSIADEIFTIAKDKQDQIHIQGIDHFVEKEDIEAQYVSRNWLAGIALFPPTEHYMKKELTKFFEYMSAGLPIICSNFPVWKDFIETYDCGIAVDPYNDKEVKEAIEYLRINPDEVKRMGENGKKAVVEKLNWNVEEEKLVKWYKQLLLQH